MKTRSWAQQETMGKVKDNPCDNTVKRKRIDMENRKEQWMKNIKDENACSSLQKKNYTSVYSNYLNTA